MTDAKRKNLIIAILLVVAIASISYIIYDKTFTTRQNNNDQEETPNKENQEEENNQPNDNESSSNDLAIDFEKLFTEAEETYALFTSYVSPDIDCENSALEDYCLFKSEYKSLAEIETKVKSLFTKELALKILETKSTDNKPLYQDANGKLYRVNGYIGQFDYTTRENNLTISKVNDEKVIIHNAIHFQGNEFIGEKTVPYDYVVIKENNNWVFNNFELPVSFYFLNA